MGTWEFGKCRDLSPHNIGGLHPRLSASPHLRFGSYSSEMWSGSVLAWVWLETLHDQRLAGTPQKKMRRSTRGKTKAAKPQASYTHQLSWKSSKKEVLEMIIMIKLTSGNLLLRWWFHKRTFAQLAASSGIKSGPHRNFCSKYSSERTCGRWWMRQKGRLQELNGRKGTKMTKKLAWKTKRIGWSEAKSFGIALGDLLFPKTCRIQEAVLKASPNDNLQEWENLPAHNKQKHCSISHYQSIESMSKILSGRSNLSFQSKNTSPEHSSFQSPDAPRIIDDLWFIEDCTIRVTNGWNLPQWVHVLFIPSNLCLVPQVDDLTAIWNAFLLQNDPCPLCIGAPWTTQRWPGKQQLSSLQRTSAKEHVHGVKPRR